MTTTDVQDLIVWDRDGIATLPDNTDVPCDNPFDWTPIAHENVPTHEEDA